MPSKPKPIKVNIKGDYPETRKVRPFFTSEGKTLLVMEKATEHKVGWTVDVTGHVSRDNKNKMFIDVIRGDLYPIKYGVVDHDTKIRKEIFPFFSLDAVKEFADLEVFKKGVGNVKSQLEKLTPIMWVMLVLVIIACIIGAVNIVMANNIGNAIGKIPIPTPLPTHPPTG